MTIVRDKLTLDQEDSGYRYSPDSFLLADFFRADDVKSAADLCAGVGVVSILIGMAHPRVNMTALEIRPGLARRARINARKSGLENYSPVNADIMDAPSLFKGRPFDSVVSNPPYRKFGSGRISPDPGRAIAKHELKMTLGALVEISSRILRKGGSLTIIMAYDRQGEYRSILKADGFCETRFREVITLPGGAPKLFLSEARFHTGEPLATMAPLILRSAGGGDSDQLKKIMERYAG